jgi:hypothetical protein
LINNPEIPWGEGDRLFPSWGKTRSRIDLLLKVLMDSLRHHATCKEHVMRIDSIFRDARKHGGRWLGQSEKTL